MLIQIKIFSIFKIKFFLNIKIYKILILIVKKTLMFNYFKIKKSFFLKNNFKHFKENIIIINHDCFKKKIIHCIKHFLNINHNSLLENKINDLF